MTTLYCLFIAALLMSLDMIVEMFCLMVMMTEREVKMMMMRGRKKPMEKRKMLYVVSCVSLHDGAQLIPFCSGL